MKTRWYILLFILLGTAGTKAYGQDTSLPVMMSRHVYDSTLKALKQEAAQKKISPVKTAVANTTARQADSARRVDSAASAEAVAKMNKPDTAKKKHIRYAPTGYLALTASEAYPQGDFKAKGYPLKGYAFFFTAAFPGTVSHLGILFKAGFGANGFDGVRYTKYLTNTLPYPLLAYSMHQTDYYTYKTLLTGLYYTRPFKRFAVDVHLLFGVMAAVVPGVTVNIANYGIGPQQLVIASFKATGRAFALDEGLTFRYMLNPRLWLMLSADNFSASPSFTVASSSVEQDLYGAVQQANAAQSTMAQPFHLLTVNVGAAYTLLSKKNAKQGK